MKNVVQTTENIAKVNRAVAHNTGKPPAYISAEKSIQAKLNIVQPHAQYEKETDSGGEKIQTQLIQRKSEEEEGPLQAKLVQKQTEEEEEILQTKLISERSDSRTSSGATWLENQLQSTKGSGNPLSDDTRATMENRFGADFSSVKVHTGVNAVQMNKELNAQAFTQGNDIYFNSSKYNPESSSGKHLLAHELTHNLQQKGQSSLNQSGKGPHEVNNTIQRAIEITDPGKGNQSVFDRRQELIDKLNTTSSAIQYHLDGNRIAYTVINEVSLTYFDEQMRGFIDKEQIIPLRLVGKDCRVLSQASKYVKKPGESVGKLIHPHVPVLFDSFRSGFVDLDDMLNTDNYGFQTLLLHFLAERFAVKDYVRLIGMDDEMAKRFNRAHYIGRDAQVDHFRSIFNDPTIKFVDDLRYVTNHDIVYRIDSSFKSDRGYIIFINMEGPQRELTSAKILVRTKEGEIMSIEDFLASNGNLANDAASVGGI